MTSKTSKSPRRFARQSNADAPTNPSAGKTDAPEPDAAQPSNTAAPRSTRPASKIATITDLLTRTGGASLDEMITATGWLPHTTRAALTGLRKKGYAITKDKVDDVTRYTIAGPAQS